MQVVEKGSVTELTTEHRGVCAVVGSHGGAASGAHAARMGVGALVCHDAGIGRDSAGVASLDLLNGAGVPAVAVGHETARIGDAADMMRRGVLMRVNAVAEGLGCHAGQATAEAVALIAASESAGFPPGFALPDASFRAERLAARDGVGLRLLDSASSVAAEDAGGIVVTGSHGGLPGGAATRAIKAPVAFGVFNDAGIGIDRSGVTRLDALDGAGIPAVCVSHDSARIGDARSSYETGVISVANDAARALGLAAGLTIAEAIDRIIAAHSARG